MSLSQTRTFRKGWQASDLWALGFRSESSQSDDQDET